jgi:YD repeat-containing protein
VPAPSVLGCYGYAADFVDNYSYDARGNMIQETQSAYYCNGYLGGNAVAPKCVDFGYCACGCCLMSSASYNAAIDTGTPVVETAYTYNYAAQVASITNTDGGNSLLSSYAWSYDADGRVSSATSSQDGTLDYSYDGNGQLTGVTSGSNTIESHSYDANGNRNVTGTDVVGAGNRLLYDGTYYYQYDAEGNCIAKFRNSTLGDGQLDSTASDITTYTYDNRNRLTGVSYQAAFGGAYSYVVDYTYDAFDRLVGADQTVGGGQFRGQHT